MAYICKGTCKLNGLKKGMINLRSLTAYRFANCCSKCSDQEEVIWYLKWVKHCPCCGSELRRKSKHSKGREDVTLYRKNKTLI